MADVEHEGAAADGGAVDPRGRDAEVPGHFGRGVAGGGDAVDVFRREAAVGERVQSGVGVEADLREVGYHAEFGRLRGADDGDALAPHAAPPAGRNFGSVTSSVTASGAS